MHLAAHGTIFAQDVKNQPVGQVINQLVRADLTGHIACVQPVLHLRYEFLVCGTVTGHMGRVKPYY
jgi:hypothetical protein